MPEPTSEASQARGALHGVRVLEFSQIVAGPFAGVVLSDLGADVVKVEPPEGEGYRNQGTVIPGESKRFQSLNRGKRSLIIDLQQEEGRALVRRIVPAFDVVLVNYRPGIPERWGLDYDTLKALNPGLIYVSITGFGDKGPMAGLGATDLVAGAYGGLVAGNERMSEDGGPMQPTPAIADYTTGMACALGVAAALLHRRETGEGQRVDTSLLRSALTIQDFYVMRQDVTDVIQREPMLAEINRLRREGAPYSALIEARRNHRTAGAGGPRLYYAGYSTSDGTVVLGCLTKPTRAGARRVLGMTEIDQTDDVAFDPHDPTMPATVAGWKEIIAERVRQQPTSYWMDRFIAAGVPAAPVQFPEELSDDPQIIAQGMMTAFDHPVTGPQRVVGPVLTMSVTPTRAQRPSPALGVDSEDVLRESGVDDAEIERLRALGVTGTPAKG